MDQKPNEIVQRINSERDRLGENLNELETRVHRVTDWRSYYAQHPYWFVGAALGGGLLLAGALSGSRDNSHAHMNKYRNASAGASAAALTGSPMSRVSESIDEIKGAVIGLGIAKVKEVLSQFLPGLREHLNETARTSPS